MKCGFKSLCIFVLAMRKCCYFLLVFVLFACEEKTNEDAEEFQNSTEITKTAETKDDCEDVCFNDVDDTKERADLSTSIILPDKEGDMGLRQRNVPHIEDSCVQ